MLMMSGCSNPAVKAGEVGYVTNEPFLFGERGEYLGIIIGPSSYGAGWRNQIKYRDTYKPFTIKEYFSAAADSSEGAQKDTRIMSKDEINMEVSVSIVFCLRNSPATHNFQEEQFKTNSKSYFENWYNFWPDRLMEPFRTQVRNTLRSESYSSAKENRERLSASLKLWLDEELSRSPIEVMAVNISNINPPQRMLAEQELAKAAEIATYRQGKEKSLQDARKEVLVQEAENLQAALEIAPNFLAWRELTIKEKYVEGFNNLITGEEAASISKAIFVPYGTPISAQQ